MGLIDILNPLLGPILDRVIPDPAERRAYELKVAEIAQAEEARASAERIAQTEVNKVEAGSSVLFVAGWRPFVGWGCGSALIYSTILAPMFHLGVPDLSFLQTILLGMLGINVAARSVEKIKGVAQNSLAGPQPVGQPNEPVLQKPKGLGSKVFGKSWPF